MDTLIIVIYLNVESFTPETTSEAIHQLQASLKKREGENPNIIHYIMPTFEAPKIECINPKLLKEEDFSSVKATLDNIQITLDNFLKIKQ